MVVPLANVLAQRPPLAAVRPLIQAADQLDVLAALQNVEDDYKEQILKLVVTLTEQSGSEVDPDIWEAYYELKTPAALNRVRELAREPSKIRFDLGFTEIETHENRDTLVQAGGTGHRTWESSLAICEYICSHPSEFRGESAIELGAGTGIVSLALASLGVERVFATDGSETVVDKLRTTAAHNKLDVTTLVLDWDAPANLDVLPRNSTIVGGDILYGLTSSYSPILDLLEQLQPQRAVFANPIRNVESYELFKTLCLKRGYNVKLLAAFAAESAEETDYMFIVSIPPIRVEIIELTSNED